MVVERYKNRDADPVYRRFQEKGRMAPEGLRYVTSWVETDLACCYQLMEADDPALLQQWMDRWRDIVDFEVHEVVSSEEAYGRVKDRWMMDNSG